MRHQILELKKPKTTSNHHHGVLSCSPVCVVVVAAAAAMLLNRELMLHRIAQTIPYYDNMNNNNPHTKTPAFIS